MAYIHSDVPLPVILTKYDIIFSVVFSLQLYRDLINQSSNSSNTIFIDKMPRAQTLMIIHLV